VRQVSRRTASRRTAQRTRRSLANPTRRPSLSCGGTLHACRQPRVQTVSPSGAAHAVVVNSSTPGKLIWPGGTVSFRVRVCPVDLANGCRRTRRMRLPRMACPKPARRVLRECGSSCRSSTRCAMLRCMLEPLRMLQKARRPSATRRASMVGVRSRLSFRNGLCCM